MYRTVRHRITASVDADFDGRPFVGHLNPPGLGPVSYTHLTLPTN